MDQREPKGSPKGAHRRPTADGRPTAADRCRPPADRRRPPPTADRQPPAPGGSFPEKNMGGPWGPSILKICINMGSTPLA